MSSSNGWVNVSFDFHFDEVQFDLDEVDMRALLQGLGRAVAYLLTTQEEMDRIGRDKVGVYVRNLRLHAVDFLTDDDINRWLDSAPDPGGDT